MKSKATLFGHPIHVMLVGFPVAFYTSTFVGYGSYAITGNRFWYQLAVVANVAGVVTGTAAAIPGLIDWLFAIPTKHPAKSTGLKHMFASAGALTIFSIDAYLQAGKWSDARPDYAMALALAAVGVGLTVVAGVLGWRMVQKHHVGVDPTAS